MENESLSGGPQLEPGDDGFLENADAMHDEFEGDDEKWLHPELNKWLLVQDSDESDEDTSKDDLAIAFGQFTRVRAVEDQPEFQKLQEMGLSTRPPGCSLGIHPKAMVWRSYSQGTPHFSRSFQLTSGRNSWQALLRVMELMLEAYQGNNPKDKYVKLQLARIRQLREQEPSHKD